MESPTPQEVAQVLEDAADLLLVHGRCAFHREDYDGRLCLAGAVAAAAFGDPHSNYVFAAPAWQALAASGPFVGWRFEPWLNPVMWNDRTETTDEDVRDLLLHTAKTCRNEATA